MVRSSNWHWYNRRRLLVRGGFVLMRTTPAGSKLAQATSKLFSSLQCISRLHFLHVFFFLGGYEPERGQESPSEGEGLEHQTRDGHPVHHDCCQNCKWISSTSSASLLFLSSLSAASHLSQMGFGEGGVCTIRPICDRDSHYWEAAASTGKVVTSLRETLRNMLLISAPCVVVPSYAARATCLYLLGSDHEWPHLVMEGWQLRCQLNADVDWCQYS